MKLAERRKEVFDAYAARVEQLLRAQILKFWEESWKYNHWILRDTIDEALLNDEKVEYKMVLITNVSGVSKYPYPYLTMIVEWDDKEEKVWEKMGHQRKEKIIAKALKEGTQDFFEDATIEVTRLDEVEAIGGAVITINCPPTTPNN